jgi:DNA-binding CsgD family transcriptional regulator
MARVAPQQLDARAWRRELLTGLIGLLPATAAAAVTLTLPAGGPPAVAAVFDAGFPGEARRRAFLQEVNAAPFRDLLSRRALAAFLAGGRETYTAARADLVPAAEWAADPHVAAHRRPAGTGDCVLSLARGPDRQTAYALVAFAAAGGPVEPAAGEGGAGGEGGRAGDGATFGPRERGLLDALHTGLAPVYRAEEAAGRVSRPTELTPRLRQTLEGLLAGDTERQVALKLSLSVHTVHDYVKALYVHFGVSSRGELLAKWIQTRGQGPGR